MKAGTFCFCPVENDFPFPDLPFVHHTIQISHISSGLRWSYPTLSPHLPKYKYPWLLTSKNNHLKVFSLMGSHELPPTTQVCMQSVNTEQMGNRSGPH